MTERVIKSCRRDDDEEPKFMADAKKKLDYEFLFRVACDSSDGDPKVSAAILALAVQVARIADVIEFAAETEAVF